MIGILALLGFISTIFGANYLIGHVGYGCSPVCVIPVWFGIYAPSGVLAAGLAFTLRDVVQNKLGVRYTILAIIIGAALSAWVSPGLALASGGTFLFSEMLDLWVYTPLKRYNFLLAVIASNTVGLTADSIMFLWLAFGGLGFLAGQIIGKIWMTLIVLPFLIKKHPPVFLDGCFVSWFDQNIY